MDDLASQFKEHPALIIGAVVIVAILAFMSRGGSSSGPVAFSGEQAPGVDPNAAAIEEAAIQAGQSGVSAIAGLLAQENTNASELTASLAQTQAGIDINASNNATSLAASKINADALTSIAETNAQVEQQRTAAQQKVQSQQISSGQAIARANDNTQLVGSVIEHYGGTILNGIGNFVGGII